MNLYVIGQQNTDGRSSYLPSLITSDQIARANMKTYEQLTWRKRHVRKWNKRR